MLRSFRPDYEAWTIAEFKRHAPMLSERRVPAEGDRLAGCL